MTILENDGVIHAVLAFCDPQGTYSCHAAVVMVTIFERTKSPVCIHILHDETLTENNRALLRETAESFGQTIAFHDVSSRVESIGDVAVELSRHWSRGALFRFFIQDVVSQDRAIYLDSDILVNLDIRELWEVSLENRSLAGVLDRPGDKPFRRFSAKAFRCLLMGCDPKTYVNSGVLVMDLSRVRKKYDLIPQSVRWFKRHRRRIEFPDQDLINASFRGDIKIINSRFNSARCDGDISGRILHARGNHKPWNSLEGSEMERLYWRTFLRTPWGRLSPEEVADVMIDVVRDSPYTHRRVSRCYSNLLGRLRRDISRSDAPKIAWLLLKDSFYMLKGMFLRQQ